MNIHRRFSKLLQVAVVLTVSAVPARVWAQQGVGIDVPSPHQSAVLDLNDTGNKRGLLVPCMNSTEREEISSPADGLLVYDTDQKMFYHYDEDAGKWQAVNPFSYRKGPSSEDEENFVIEFTNDERSVVIGTVATPVEKLEVGGNIRATGTVISDEVQSNSLTTPSGSITTLTSTTINTTTTNTTDVAASGTVTATGNISTTGEFVGNGTIPIGGIIMWAGDVVPAGWQLCDGSNGTPDLRGRFVVGIGQATGPGAGPTSYALHDTGGSEINYHTHIVDPIPAETAPLDDNDHKSDVNGTGNSTVAKRNHTHSFDTPATESTGPSNQENRPPYYALAYIMRIE